MDVVNSHLEVSMQVSKVLQAEVDNLQQYSRRYTVILDRMAPKPNESNRSVENKVKNIFILTTKFSVNRTKLEQEFDKAHRVGKMKDLN